MGKVFHDAPQVLHYGQAGTGIVLEPGMIFTIEPMINAGGYQLKTLPDKWTTVTKDNSETPLVLMGYFNPIHKYGVPKFIADAKEAGVDGLIVVDMPPEHNGASTLPRPGA